jgi:hypothetical protein
MRYIGMVPILVVTALAGCSDLVGDQVLVGSGRLEYERRNVGSFTGISNSTAADVEIVQNFADEVWVRAEDNLQRHIRTRVDNGVLRIYTDGVTLRPRQAMVVEVDVRTLNRIQSSGSGFISAPLVDAGRLEINSSGSGDISVPSLLGDSVVVVSSGSGDIDVSGDVTRIRLNMSGSGRVEARELQALQADATISGGGSAVIRVRDVLRAILSGAGFLRYFGSPTVDQTVTGTGMVERLGN